MEKSNLKDDNLDFQKLSLKDEKKISKFTFKEFQIITNVVGEFKIYLPLEISDFLNISEDLTGKEFLDFQTFSKFFDFSKNTIDMSSNPFISNKMILQSIFAFLGSINENNDYLKFTSDEYIVIEKENYIQNFLERSFRDYIEKNISIIFSNFKVKDYELMINSLKFIGVRIDFKIENTSETSKLSIHNSLYLKMRNYVLSHNKLLILVAASNNFWIKSEKITIGTVSYDRKINNYSHIFMNWDFVKKFYDRIANHPRCIVGFLNSMQKKNLLGCVETIGIRLKNFTKYLLFDQDCHDNNAPSNSKPIFVRNMEKIKSKCKSSGCDTEINETNLIILESESDKITTGTKSNSLIVNLFSEDFMTYTPEEKENFRNSVEKLLNYLEILLNESDCDMREWIANNPLNKP